MDSQKQPTTPVKCRQLKSQWTIDRLKVRCTSRHFQGKNNHRSYKITTGQKHPFFGKWLVSGTEISRPKINYPTSHFFKNLITGGLSRVIDPLAEYLDFCVFKNGDKIGLLDAPLELPNTSTTKQLHTKKGLTQQPALHYHKREVNKFPVPTNRSLLSWVRFVLGS